MDELFIAIASCFVFVWGIAVGSFLNVVVYRLPAGLSLIYPPSRCPHCLHPLGKTENVPVFGWLWLRGRCRWCKTSISSRYPIVEAVTGFLFLCVFWHFGWSLTTVGYCLFLSWLLALSLIDLDTMTLPGALTKSGLVVGLAYQITIGFSSGFPEIADRLMFGINGAVVGIWLLFSIYVVGTIIFQQQAMGDADEHLMAMIGAWLGWKYVLLSGFLACLTGALVGGGAIALGFLGRRQPMPFGPFLALGAVLSVFWGERILSIYFDLFSFR